MCVPAGEESRKTLSEPPDTQDKKIEMMKIKLFTIPNLVTLCNLLCGSMAAVTALTGGSLVVAFWLVVAAAVCDFLDGMTARLLHSYSGIGVELDSLADMVSFGFAPAAVLYAIYTQSEWHLPASAWVQSAGAVALFLLTAFSALRLAKFNVDEEQHTEFKGLPTPACALFFVALGWLVEREILFISCGALLSLALIFALLLIAPIRMFSFKFAGLGLRENSLRYGFALVALALLLWLGVGAVPLVILLYVITSAVRHLVLVLRGAKDKNRAN